MDRQYTERIKSLCAVAAAVARMVATLPASPEVERIQILAFQAEDLADELIASLQQHSEAA
jgi:hypothetical protein